MHELESFLGALFLGVGIQFASLYSLCNNEMLKKIEETKEGFTLSGQLCYSVDRDNGRITIKLEIQYVLSLAYPSLETAICHETNRYSI